MINIMLEREIYPELIQYNLSASNILKSVDALLINDGYYNIKEDFVKANRNLLQVHPSPSTN